MWDLVRIDSREDASVSKCLGQGYEPFDVSTDTYGVITIWFKKKVEDSEVRIRRLKWEVAEWWHYYSGAKNEIYSQPKPVKRTGRKATAKA